MHAQSESGLPPASVWLAVIIRLQSGLLRHWIVWHLLQGVSHVLIYDNHPPKEHFGSSALAAAAAPFVNAGLATVIRWRNHPGQNDAYEDAVTRARRRGVGFIALWDVDEFSILPSGDRCLTRYLCDCAVLGDCGSVQLNWRMTRDSGAVVSRSGQSMMETVNYDPGTLHKLVKTIVRTVAHKNASAKVHSNNVRSGFCRMGEDLTCPPSVTGRAWEGKSIMRTPPSGTRAAIWHARCTSLADQVFKKSMRGRADVKGDCPNCGSSFTAIASAYYSSNSSSCVRDPHASEQAPVTDEVRRTERFLRDMDALTVDTLQQQGLAAPANTDEGRDSPPAAGALHRTARMAASAGAHTQIHGVCITGLERSYPEISHNIHYSLSNLYRAWQSGSNPATLSQYNQDGVSSSWQLEHSVAFFGVRPANDSWPTVRTDLPALSGESIQTPCGPRRSAWFTAWARTATMKYTYGLSFAQMMCDLRACHQLVLEHENKVGRRFETLARLRLDLAWETPLVMPERILPNTVYTSRMNAKTGINDKWALGRRDAMAVYLERARLIPLLDAMLNKSAAGIGIKAASKREGMLHYGCAAGMINMPFACAPYRGQGTAWQRPDDVGLAYRSNAPVEVPAHPPQRKFALSSEAFLMWALWRGNVTIAFEPAWMFCKFGNSVNFTSRLCVPRMRQRKPCSMLVCQGGLTDCYCNYKNQTSCIQKAPGKKNSSVAQWYCELTGGKQLALDPYDKRFAGSGLY